MQVCCHHTICELQVYIWFPICNLFRQKLLSLYPLLSISLSLVLTPFTYSFFPTHSRFYYFYTNAQTHTITYIHTYIAWVYMCIYIHTYTHTHAQIYKEIMCLRAEAKYFNKFLFSFYSVWVHTCIYIQCVFLQFYSKAIEIH